MSDIWKRNGLTEWLGFSLLSILLDSLMISVSVITGLFG